MREAGVRGKRLGHHAGHSPCQVLLQEPNPGVQFEFWLPQERYGPFQAQAQALGWPLRQPQPREVEPQSPESPAGPARVPTLAPGEVWTVRVGQARDEASAPHCTIPHRSLPTLS
jgi:hypothetical protein